MRSLMRMAALASALPALAWAALWAQAWPIQEAGALKQETIHLKTVNSRELSGYIAQDGKTQLTFVRFYDQPGQRPMTNENVFDLEEIERFEKLPAPDRKKLADRLKAIADERKKAADRLAAVAIEKTDSPSGKPLLNHRHKVYALQSDLSEPLFRDAAVRFDALFALLEAKLPPAHAGQPLPIYLRASQRGLLAWQTENRTPLPDLALFDAKANAVVAGSDVEAYAADLAQLRQEQAQQTAKLDDYLTRLKSHFGGKPPAGGLLQVRQIRLQVQDFDVENQHNFDAIFGRFLRAAGREATRAWLARRVAPEATAPPRWLEEGLSQVFAATLLDSGETQFGAMNEAALAAAQAALRQNELWPLEKLLSAGDGELPANVSQEHRLRSRGYLTAAMLGHYLAVEKKLTEGPALAELLRSGRDRQAFEKFVGQPLPEFEKQFRDWLARRTPGS